MVQRVEDGALLRQHRATRVPTSAAVRAAGGAGDAAVLTPPADARDIHRGTPGSVPHVPPDRGHLPSVGLARETARVLRHRPAPTA